jgi:hypothetical protein
MSTRKLLARLRKVGVTLVSVTSHGGGGRGHSSWDIEFSVQGAHEHHNIRTDHSTLYGSTWRECEREARETAVALMAEKFQIQQEG